MVGRCGKLKSEELNLNEVLGYLNPDQLATYRETREQMRRLGVILGLLLVKIRCYCTMPVPEASDAMRLL